MISSGNVKRYNKTNSQKPKTSHTVHIERTTFHSPRSITPNHDHNTRCVAGCSPPPLHSPPLHHRGTQDQSQADGEQRPQTQSHRPTLQRLASADHSLVQSMTDHTRWFKNQQQPPVTQDQLRSVGVDPDCLYWSPTFHCWCLSGDWVRPYATTARLLDELGLDVHPDS